MNKFLESQVKTRATLILDQKGVSATLTKQLSGKSWQIYVADTIKEFKKLFKQHRFEVIIVYFNREQVPPIADFETLASLNIVTKWIAIIPSEEWLNSHPSMLFSHLFYDYHRQPLRYEHLLATIGHAYGMAKLQNEKLGQLQIKQQNDDIIGQSQATQKLRERINAVANKALPVLISGESGTGKQLLGRIIHQQYSDPKCPLATVSCGGIPESLVHSELFGHDTGALNPNGPTKVGHIEQCNKGTLLLNDIEELPLQVQASLVQYIEKGEFFRLGSTQLSTSCCRIIATTNSDLRKAVNKHTFREDLYHALSSATIEVPTLRERYDDVPYLAQYFLSQFCAQGEMKSFSQCALNAMQHYHWPGNVRELMNRIRRAIILSEGHIINEAHLELPHDNNTQQLTLKEARNKVEKDIVVRSIAQAGFNHSQAAKNLGISRTSLYRLIAKHQIPM